MLSLQAGKNFLRSVHPIHIIFPNKNSIKFIIKFFYLSVIQSTIMVIGIKLVTTFFFITLLSRKVLTSSESSSSINNIINNMADQTVAYVSGMHSVAFVTVPDDVSAKKLAHGMIDQKLAACVNIIPQVTSIYSWDGKVNEDTEVMLMIKTSTEKVDQLSKYVRDNHQYSVAEVISIPIENGNQPYLDWMTKILK